MEHGLLGSGENLPPAIEPRSVQLDEIRPPRAASRRLICVSAIALNRMDRTREALAVLDQAARAIGETSLLRAVRESEDRYLIRHRGLSASRFKIASRNI
jgi:hypothetical protein